MEWPFVVWVVALIIIIILLIVLVLLGLADERTITIKRTRTMECSARQPEGDRGYKNARFPTVDMMALCEESPAG